MTIRLRPILFITAMLSYAGLPAAAGEAKPLVLQIEAFKLTNTKAVKMKGASGGKVVVFADEKAKAETTFKLPSGWYEGTLYVWAKDDTSDTTHLLIEADDYEAGVSELPVCPWDKKKIAPCFPMKFRVGDANQERKIVLRADDLGVRIDRLEIKRMGK